MPKDNLTNLHGIKLDVKHCSMQSKDKWEYYSIVKSSMVYIEGMKNFEFHPLRGCKWRKFSHTFLAKKL